MTLVYHRFWRVSREGGYEPIFTGSVSSALRLKRPSTIRFCKLFCGRFRVMIVHIGLSSSPTTARDLHLFRSFEDLAGAAGSQWLVNHCSSFQQRAPAGRIRRRTLDV